VTAKSTTAFEQRIRFAAGYSNGNGSGLHAGVEDSGFDTAAPLDLHENAVVARLGETIGEADNRRRGSGVCGVRIGSGELKRGHGDRASRVDVGENASVGLEEEGVSGHPHVELETVGRIEAEAERRGTAGAEGRAVALPGERRREVAGGIVASKRAPRYGGEVDFGGGGFGQTVGPHYVGEESVAAGGHGGEVVDEQARFKLVGVQVPDAIERRQAGYEQVHQVAVVGEKLVEGARKTLAGGLAEPQEQATGRVERRRVKRWFQRDGLIEEALDEAGFGVPPAVTEVQKEEDDDGGAGHGAAGEAAALG